MGRCSGSTEGVASANAGVVRTRTVVHGEAHAVTTGNAHGRAQTLLVRSVSTRCWSGSSAILTTGCVKIYETV